MAQVGIVMGSDSDMPIMAKAADILEKLGRHNEAHDIYEACYRKRKETLGEDHPDTQSLLSYLSE